MYMKNVCVYMYIHTPSDVCTCKHTVQLSSVTPNPSTNIPHCSDANLKCIR